MKNPDDKLSRDDLLQGAGAASIASLVAAAMVAAPEKAAAAAPDIFAGPWNLSLAKSPTKPVNTKKAKRRTAPPLPTSPVDYVTHSPKAPTTDDIPPGYALIKCYKLDLPAWVKGKDGDDDPDDSDWKPIMRPRYIGLFRKI